MENNINNENNNENNIKNNKDVDINSTAENNHESLNTDDEILDAHENENTVVIVLKEKMVYLKLLL